MFDDSGRRYCGGMKRGNRDGDDPLRLSLNAFLLRPDVLPLEAIAESALPSTSFFLWRADHLDPLPPEDAPLLAAAAAGDVAVAVTDRQANPPPWQLFVRDVLNMPSFGSAGRSQGAALFCAVQEPDGHEQVRWVAYTFGAASHAIRRRAIEPRFGLLVALNRIAIAHGDDTDPRLRGRLRQASYRGLGPFTFNAGYRAASDTPLDSFRIDRVVDLLYGAGGPTRGDSSGQVFGARALKTREPVESVDDLVGLAAAALTDFRATDYRGDFSFIDQMVPVYDDGLELALRQQVFHDVVSLKDTIDVLVPDDLVPYEDERSICYVVRPGVAAAKACDLVLTVDMVAGIVRDEGAAGLDRDLRFSDASRSVIATTSILDCLAGEVRIGDDRFVLYDGDFYRVDGTLLDRIDAALATIPVVTLDMPAYGGGPEGEWNRDAATVRPERYVVLDGCFVYLPGQSPFEACDILDTDGALIHVKRKSRSSTMSHLFVQAERSCQLLCEVDAARLQLREHIDDATAATATDSRAARHVADRLASRNHGVRLVFALLGDWHGKTLANLPLLARLSLVASVPAIRRLGFEPSVALVPLSSRQ